MCIRDRKKVGEGNKYEVQVPTFVSANLIGMLLGGHGKITLAPQVGERLDLSNNEITDFSFRMSPSTGEEHISITLNDEYGKKWETMTTNNLKKKVTIIVDGMIVSSPNVHSPISVGKFSMANENKEYLKLINSLLKNPSEKVVQPKFQTKLFLVDDEGTTEMPLELEKEYYALQHGFAQNSHAVFQVIDGLPLEPYVKQKLKEDIQRMIDLDLGGYLGHDKFNLPQFRDVMGNARKVLDKTLMEQKMKEEQRLKKMKDDDGLPF